MLRMVHVGQDRVHAMALNEVIWEQSPTVILVALISLRPACSAGPDGSPRDTWPFLMSTCSKYTARWVMCITYRLLVAKRWLENQKWLVTRWGVQVALELRCREERLCSSRAL